MPKFNYTVQDAQGGVSSGVVEAGDEDQAVLLLQNKGLFILSIQQESAAKVGGRFLFRKLGGGKVKGHDLAFFGEQLATLLTGGVPLVRSLSLLAEHGENRDLAAVISDISKEVAAGGSLYKSLEKHHKVFDPIWIFPSALRQIANYIQGKERIKGKIITAVAYPCVLVFVSSGILTYFVLYIVPVFARVFKDFNLKLPAITQIVVGISTAVTSHFLIIAIAVAALVFLIKSYVSTEVGRLGWNRIQLKLPLFGNFIRNILLERLLTTMATLIKSGVSILNTITVLEGAFAGNLMFQRALRVAKADVAAGKSISVAFKNTGLFPGLVTEMIWMGEESGKLPDIIHTLSRFYEERINQFVARFAALIDPVLIVGVGSIIAVIVISMFMPIFQLARVGQGGG
ncbi:MAG: type II secretion system F family protein [Elusimicrobia bacterium]|nr:type II secretion system F family protein [Elusimicrobiota bacterium]